MLYIIFLVVTLHVEVCAWYHLRCMLPIFLTYIHLLTQQVPNCMLPTFSMYLNLYIRNCISVSL